MIRAATGVVLLFGLATATWGADLTIQPLKTSPPEDLAKPIAEKLATSGLAVKDGNKTVCELWLAKQWPVQSDPSFSLEILYPLKAGELVGAIRFPSRGSDFRDQVVPAGVYTLRYALQPVDGNHIGTFPTRDFLAMLSAEKDRDPGAVDDEELQQRSIEDIESSHPGILCLLGPAEAQDEMPAIRHDEQNDWWIVTLVGKTVSDGQEDELVVDLVVAGHAAE